MAADLIFFCMHLIIVQEIQNNFYSKTRSWRSIDMHTIDMHTKEYLIEGHLWERSMLTNYFDDMSYFSREKRR